MLMYNLSLWNYDRDKSSYPLSLNSESFQYKTSIVRKTPENKVSCYSTRKLK